MTGGICSTAGRGDAPDWHRDIPSGAHKLAMCESQHMLAFWYLRHQPGDVREEELQDESAG